MTFLAIDPGIDAAGVVAFEPSKARRIVVLQDCRAALVEVVTIRSTVGAPLPHRLAQLAAALADVCTRHRPELVVLERPRFGGVYRRHRKGARSTNGQDGVVLLDLGNMHLATGVLAEAARAAGARVEFREASEQRKSERHPLVLTTWPHLAKVSEDARDAAFIGIQVLLDGRRRWSAPAAAHG